jgi:hypothetical protein
MLFFLGLNLSEPPPFRERIETAREDYCVRFGAASTFSAQPNSSEKEICNVGFN